MNILEKIDKLPDDALPVEVEVKTDSTFPQYEGSTRVVETITVAELKGLVKAYRAALDYIEKTPCDPDITSEQLEAYKLHVKLRHEVAPQ